MGCAFTNPFVSAGSRSVTTVCASRRSAAASVAPNRAPASIRGAGPSGWGRAWWMDPSFFGYPWCSPRAIAKSLSTQM